MAEHNTLGKDGEEAAVNYLLEHNYVIRHRNWRNNHLELDIVAVQGGELIIVEVKTRTNTKFTQPQDAVTEKKIKRTVVAANIYVRRFRLNIPVRFDIITVVGRNGSFEIEHLKDAFYPTV